ncbi:MAG TPA: Kiwa anti-phage protein KwaB-like domain-containing protein [Flavobacteriaceae bacterium]|nr:Kiwa anti-phage protein KwaB-like domain-containing protein [Flavobacteriaceae bacterium]
MSNIGFARKVLKIRNSPVLRNNTPNAVIITFTKTHPALRNKMIYSFDDSQIIIETKISKELFIKMLDDANLTSELTNQFYESKANDAVTIEKIKNYIQQRYSSSRL